MTAPTRADVGLVIEDDDTATVSTSLLAVRAGRGDRDAFGELYERYADMVLRVACAKLPGDRAAAEDVAAETWLRVARSIPGYRPTGGGFPAWLQTIVGRLVIDKYRGGQRRRETPTGDLLALEVAAEGDTPEMVAIRKDLAASVSYAVNQLPRRQRDCLNARFFHGLSVQETAVMLGMSEGNVRVSQCRGLKSLAAILPRDLVESRSIGLIDVAALPADADMATA